MLPIRPNQRLGPFVLQRLLGQGAFSQVWKALRRWPQERIVALKVPFAQDRHAEVLAEAQLMHRLRHPHIVEVREAGVYDDVLALELEYLTGGTLKTRLGEPRRPLPLEEVVRHVVQVLTAVECAHRCRVLHLDLKPSNIFLSEVGAKVGDFGLARVLGPQGTAVAERGTTFYMAPEHLQGQPCPASDVWGVGVLLYELLTGQRPFIGTDPLAVARAIFRLPPPPPTDFNPTLPYWVEAVILRALAKDPQERYPSAAALREALLEGCPQAGEALEAALAWEAGQREPDAVRMAEAAAFIPAGAFFMGSGEGSPDERPVHRVFVDAFMLARYTVTNAQWRAFLEANPEWRRDRIPPEYHNGHYLDHWIGDTYPEGTGNLPVIYVSWFAAEAYCAWVGGRLPTEAEWEKAAQGGSTPTRYPWGDDISPEQANFDAGDSPPGAGPEEALRRLKPVDSYAPNGYGLYQMSGNVWEWCADWYDRQAYARSPTENPLGPRAGTCRVVRGGAWSFNAGAARCASRFYLLPHTCHPAVGFRVAWDVASP